MKEVKNERTLLLLPFETNEEEEGDSRSQVMRDRYTYICKFIKEMVLH